MLLERKQGDRDLVLEFDLVRREDYEGEGQAMVLHIHYIHDMSSGLFSKFHVLISVLKYGVNLYL